MAAWTELERAKIRHALGFAAIFLQADPRAESAMSAVLAVADGGTRPDSSTQVQIQGWLADIDSLEAKMKSLWDVYLANQVEEIKVDAIRASAGMRRDGRRLVNYIATALSTNPRRDIFSKASPDAYGDTFESIYESAAGKNV